MLTNLSLFSGAGGLDLGAKIVGGFRTVAYVEYDRYAQAVLMSRMRDGSLCDAPIFEDVRTFDGRSLAGSIDVVSGGFPCQDLSVAGKRAGIIEGKRSGLWKEFARIVGEVRPRFVLVENVPGLLMGGGLGVVLGDLAEFGFNARWGVHGACAVGAPHSRERVFIIGYSNKIPMHETNTKAMPCGGEGRAWDSDTSKHWKQMASPDWEVYPSYVVGSIDGVAFRVDRSERLGNGVVPQQAAPAWQIIREMSEI